MAVTEEKAEAITVKCPCCKQRLFDMSTSTDGFISIKCAKCNTVVSVKMHQRVFDQDDGEPRRNKSCAPG